jgi:hypothetical protein
MRTAIVTLALLAIAAAPAFAEEYYWGEIGIGGVVSVDDWGEWGEIGFDGDDYYVYSYDFGDWVIITIEGDIYVDDLFWGYIDENLDVYHKDDGYLFTIEYDRDRDEFFYDGVYAFDPETVFFVLAFEEKFYGWEVGLFDVFDFNQPPLADMEYRADGSIYRYVFEVDARDLDGEITDVRWEFGDGTRSTLFDPVHTYDRGGVFDVRVTVWDDSGDTWVDTARIVIKSRPPKAKFKKRRVKGVPGQIRFVDRSYDRRDGIVVGWHWDFGDGNTSTEREPVHVYAEPGRYMITLTVTDNDGETARRIRGVKIRFKKGI